MAQDTENKDLDPSYMMCPMCQRLADTMNARATICAILDITLGYYLFCEHCGEVTFLRFMGHPPLLDLHTLGAAIWNLPEA